METSLIGKALDFGSREYGFESHVSNITVNINSVAHLVNHFKFSTQKKSLYFDVRVSARSIHLLKLFYDLNLVRRYVKLGSGVYRVYPTYTYYGGTPRRIDTYLRSSHYVTIPIDVLRIVNQHFLNSYLVLETSKGIMTHQEALKHRVSGRLIMRIH